MNAKLTLREKAVAQRVSDVSPLGPEPANVGATEPAENVRDSAALEAVKTRFSPAVQKPAETAPACS